MKRMANNMKLSALGITCLLILCILIFVINFWPSEDSLVMVEIAEYQYHEGNSRQYEASVQMACIGEQLYFYVDNGYLSVFEEGGVHPIIKIDGDVFAIQNGFVYYNRYTEDYFKKLILGYEIASGMETEIATISRSVLDTIHPDDCFATEDGTVMILSVEDGIASYSINRTNIAKLSTPSEEYIYGSNRFVVSVDSYSNRSIIRYDAEGNRYHYGSDISPGRVSVIPCESGLLIHNEYYGNLLYFIDGYSGDIVKLFSFPCDHSTSAVNVHGNYVYFSFMRYEDYDAVFGSRFENDTLEGTYCIDLRDYSVEKLSDEIYNGLYIFDNTGIFACDSNSNIYKLDFEGNIVMTLSEK